MSNHRTKKLQALFMAAIFALGIVLTPIVAIAEPAPGLDSESPQGKIDFVITSVKDKKIRAQGLLPLGKKASTYKKNTLTINSTYKLSDKFTDTTTSYKVTRIMSLAGLPKNVKAINIACKNLAKIDAKAFKGVNAASLTIKIASKKLTKAATVKNMLSGYSGKVTLKLPKSMKSTYAKVFTASNLGIKAANLTIKWVKG